MILAGTGGYLDDMPIDQVRAFETELYKFVDTSNPALLRTVMEKKTLDDTLKNDLVNVIKECKERFTAEREAVAK
jgi:F-type H+-transporting ATPase subunit alpha